jgi:hypothetical protein
MNLDDTIRLQALKLKQLNTDGSNMSDDLIDHLLKDAPQGEFRNVCATISHQLFDELTGLCSLLEISKRKFIELALVDAINKTGFIMEEVKPIQGEFA